MACILKAPTARSRGVVTFTTPERDKAILADPAIETAVRALKDRWVVGLHHHWHDFAFRHNPLFDFNLAGEDNLSTEDGSDFPVIRLDACNFVPDCFVPASGEKFWDVLYISRAVFFKGIEPLFRTVRTLYDRGHFFRILHICPVPPPDIACSNSEADPRRVYDELFSEEEQKLFNFLTINFRYPFPFDLETLAFFYRSSRVFAHFTPDERRCRVAAYAWATGLPVIAMPSVGTLLPAALQVEPYYFRVDREADFPDRIVAAVSAADLRRDTDAPRREVCARFTKPELEARLPRLFGSLGYEFEPSAMSLENLDIRLGRHHGLGAGPNSVPQSLADFIEFLRRAPDREIAGHLASVDPELAIAEEARADSAPTAVPASDEARAEPKRTRAWGHRIGQIFRKS
jgi:glycosyltransferase involved in cell wall biosynthesis